MPISMSPFPIPALFMLGLPVAVGVFLWLADRGSYEFKPEPRSLKHAVRRVL